MNDLALGAVLLAFGAVPLSLAILALLDVIPLRSRERRTRWVRACLLALLAPGVIGLAWMSWGWAGAAHLKPLCVTYADPAYYGRSALAARSLLIELAESAEEPPPWARALLARGSPLEYLEMRTARGLARFTLENGRWRSMPASATSTPASAVRLEARRVVHHQTRWFRVEMERFTLTDAGTGARRGEADEMWLTAGPWRYQCGVGSGPLPVDETSYPANGGVARFVQRALTLQAANRTTVDSGRAPQILR